MSLSLQDTDQAIFTLLNGDATLLALLQQEGGVGVFGGRAPSEGISIGDGNKPYIVYDIDSFEQNDAFDENMVYPVVYNITTYDHYDNGWKPSRDALDRVCTLLHRTTLSLSGSNVAVAARRLRGFREPNDHAYVYTHQYELGVTEG